MKLSPRAVFDQLLPESEELWRAGGASMEPFEPDPGRYVNVPYFEPEFTKNFRESLIDEREFRTKSGRYIGRQALHLFEVDNIEYLSRVLVPEKSEDEEDFTVVDSTAWMTTIDGYVGDRDAKIVIDNNLPLISIGAAFSRPDVSLVKSALKSPQAVWKTRKLSLAYAAEVEQKIIAAQRECYELPPELLLIGDSRGANIKPAQYAYAPTYGNKIISFDTKGRAAARKVELQDIPEVMSWLGTTVLGGIAVSACLLKNGRSDLLVGTGSIDPQFLAASLSGTMRSLASGETGRTIEWMPYSAHGHEVLYGLDSLSDYRTIDALLGNHSHVVRKIVLSGTHAALLHPQAHDKQRQRIHQLALEYRRVKGNVADIDWEIVHGATPSFAQATLRQAS